MKHTICFLILFFYYHFWQHSKPFYPDKYEQSLPRIAIAGLAIESRTFSPALTDEAAFHAQYGKEVFTMFPFFSADSPLLKKAIWIPTTTVR